MLNYLPTKLQKYIMYVTMYNKLKMVYEGFELPYLRDLLFGRKSGFALERSISGDLNMRRVAESVRNTTL